MWWESKDFSTEIQLQHYETLKMFYFAINFIFIRISWKIGSNKRIKHKKWNLIKNNFQQIIFNFKRNLETSTATAVPNPKLLELLT